MSKPRIGIPSAMYNHYFYPFLKTFWQEIGFIPVFSPPTNRSVLDTGVRSAVDEACLPVKVFYGHVAALEEMELDYLFLPRYSAVERATYLCPKSMGLPDMVRAELSLQTPQVITNIDLVRGETGFRQEVYYWGRQLKISRSRLVKAWQQAEKSQQQVGLMARKYQLPYPEAINAWEKGADNLPTAHEDEEGISVGLVGHGYLIYDDQISLGLINTLKQMGVRVKTPEMMPPEVINRYAGLLPKKVFWSLGHVIMGAALAWQEQKLVDGIIHATCFGCGPNSIIGEMLQLRIKELPLLMLTIDEHTGKAGQQTRLEAFLDLLERRKKRYAG